VTAVPREGHSATAGVLDWPPLMIVTHRRIKEKRSASRRFFSAVGSAPRRSAPSRRRACRRRAARTLAERVEPRSADAAPGADAWPRRTTVGAPVGERPCNYGVTTA